MIASLRSTTIGSLSIRKLIGFLVLAFLWHSAYSEELPISSFAKLPLLESPVISPDGEFVAVVLNEGDRPRVAVSRFANPTLTVIFEGFDSNDKINWLRWANNERLLVSLSTYRHGTYIYANFGFTGGTFRQNRLFAVTRDGSNPIELWRRPKVDSEVSQAVIARLNRDGVLSILPQEPDKVLLTQGHEFEESWAIMKVDIYNNTFEKQPTSPHQMSRWFADADDRISLGHSWLSTTRKVDTWYRDHSTEEWKKVNTRDYFNGPSFYPIVVEQNKALIISDFETRRDAVWSYDLDLASYDELIFVPPDNDIHAPIWDYHHNRVIGVTYFDHYERQHFFADSDVELQRIVAKSLPNRETTIVSRNRDASRLIVAADRDNSPRRYYWVDLSESRMGAWHSQYPELEGFILPRVRPISFVATDGTTISGYLTLPIASDGERPPLIVFPHDGPAERDTQAFNPMVQFLANRGYAVLQINFRGSGGFGNDYAMPRNRNWGGTMQQDVYDGIDWLDSQELVDMSRVCMLGLGYGGYVALTALHQRPAQVDCVVSLAGITDTSEFVPKHKFGTYHDVGIGVALGIDFEIGTPLGVKEEHLANPSPIKMVKHIKSPILLIHGTHDLMVDVSQSKRFFKKARRARKSIEFVKLEDGTHFLDSNEHRLTAYEAIAKFLDQHLKQIAARATDFRQ